MWLLRSSVVFRKNFFRVFAIAAQLVCSLTRSVPKDLCVQTGLLLLSALCVFLLRLADSNVVGVIFSYFCSVIPRLVLNLGRSVGQSSSLGSKYHLSGFVFSPVCCRLFGTDLRTVCHSKRVGSCGRKHCQFLRNSAAPFLLAGRKYRSHIWPLVPLQR